jgi:phage/plasmid primase-like uncharacterized protein
MLAAVCDVTGKVIGVHRTYLSRDGATKANVEPNKMMLGRCAGGAVHLEAAGTSLSIAEGIETSLAVFLATGTATWAALSTSGLLSVVLPALPLAAEVIIFADNDRSGAGKRAAKTAAARFFAERRKVRIALPPHEGLDFNDILRGVK